jgi:hypothetical protein
MPCRAGITATIKTSTLPGVGEFSDPTHQLADLLIWSNAEVVVTIIAASIPFFRVLLRTITSSYQKSKRSGGGQYRQSYRLESYGNDRSFGIGMGRRSRNRGIIEIPARGDEMSDKSILGDGMVMGARAGTAGKAGDIL